MPSYSTDRRGALKIISAIGSTCAFPYSSDELYGQTTAHHHEIAPPAPLPAAPAFFNEADFQVISRIADLIIPPTGTPGAVAAGVPFYIDSVVKRSKAQQELATSGLRWFAEMNFIHLTEKEQMAILLPLCDKADAGEVSEMPVQFFQMMKNLTADGYYTSQVGLMTELGYAGNTALASFPGCVPEH